MVLDDEIVHLYDQKFQYAIGIASEEDKKLLQQKIMDKVDKEKANVENKELLEPFFNVIRLCLHLDPNMRPSATNLLSFIENECIMELPNGLKVSFNPEIDSPKNECKPTKVTYQYKSTRRLFLQRQPSLFQRTSV
uniref:Protein kinase domain-containing protein n=1 Tax=Meloidogyne hapla TaxID=6305 RepID=A0A1I8BQS4_MELHA